MAQKIDLTVSGKISCTREQLGAVMTLYDNICTTYNLTPLCQGWRPVWNAQGQIDGVNVDFLKTGIPRAGLQTVIGVWDNVIAHIRQTYIFTEGTFNGRPYEE